MTTAHEGINFNLFTPMEMKSFQTHLKLSRIYKDFCDNKNICPVHILYNKIRREDGTRKEDEEVSDTETIGTQDSWSDGSDDDSNMSDLEFICNDIESECTTDGESTTQE